MTVLTVTAWGAFSCDIFCRVVDNFGDAGVCWRLARQLSTEFGAKVRLIIDDRASLLKLGPEATSDAEIINWPSAAALQPAACVVEAFACELPPPYLAAMAQRERPPVWLNLEYLSAEPWVAEHHLLPSPHPQYPLTKYFFFPGFTQGTGGLIREAWLAPAMTTIPVSGQPMRVFLFGYAHPALPGLLSAWQTEETPIQATIPEGALADQARRACGDGAGRLTLQTQPFRPQREFDDWLAGHDVLFVRGEDSFVRAQWAARPFVWHIYPQEGGAHWQKLNAFLDLYCENLDAGAAEALRELWRAWNAGEGADYTNIGPAWAAFREQLPALQGHAEKWAQKLREMPDLAFNLVTFYQKTVKI